MLDRCLAALDAQGRCADRVLVVDNASTDGTSDMVKDRHPRVELLALPENYGGAGGFHEGMKAAHAGGADWLWLMDDDTIPQPNALEELVAALGRFDRASLPTLLASKVVWRDGGVHPMNFPTPERTRIDRLIEGAGRGFLPIRAATFVSLLVHRGVVDRHGLPLKHFFIWSDDIEYTSRCVLQGEPAYLVPSSTALHDTASPHTAASAPPSRFYYHVRNTIFMVRGPSRPARDRVLRLWVLLSSTGLYLIENPSAASLFAILRGIRDGLLRGPRRPRGRRTKVALAARANPPPGT